MDATKRAILAAALAVIDSLQGGIHAEQDAAADALIAPDELETKLWRRKQGAEIGTWERARLEREWTAAHDAGNAAEKRERTANEYTRAHGDAAHALRKFLEAEEPEALK